MTFGEENGCSVGVVSDAWLYRTVTPVATSDTPCVVDGSDRPGTHVSTTAIAPS